MKKTALLTLLICTFSIGKLPAHPGHGNPHVADSSLHYLLEPYHSVPVFAGGILVAAAIYFWRVSRSQKR